MVFWDVTLCTNVLGKRVNSTFYPERMETTPSPKMLVSIAIDIITPQKTIMLILNAVEKADLPIFYTTHLDDLNGVFF
jgi:hypothetical protein